MEPNSYSIEHYNYHLPPEKIAFFPNNPRDSSKLLEYTQGQIHEHIFREISSLIPSQARLFFNNTKVVPARLYFENEHGGIIEIFYLEPYQNDITQGLQQCGHIQIKAYVGGVKKWTNQILKKKHIVNNKEIEIQAQKLEQKEDYYVIELSWTPENWPFLSILEKLGQIPLPPYIKRESVMDDQQNYQTTYAKWAGSVAAPTAGLHFTKAVLESLKQNNVVPFELTLHVGAGTFKPVKDEDVRKHMMHQEYVEIPKNIIQNLAQTTHDPIIAVGTTTLRSLESLYWVGVQIHREPQKTAFQVSQWEYENSKGDLSMSESMQHILDWMARENKETIAFQTQILIQPDYMFRVVDALITNFHQPKSTLLLLVSAFVGEDWKRIYDYALQHDFKFLSYGDSSLLWKNKST